MRCTPACIFRTTYLSAGSLFKPSPLPYVCIVSTSLIAFLHAFPFLRAWSVSKAVCEDVTMFSGSSTRSTAVQAHGSPLEDATAVKLVWPLWLRMHLLRSANKARHIGALSDSSI